MIYLTHVLSGIILAFKNQDSFKESLLRLLYFSKIEYKFLLVKIFRRQYSSENIFNYKITFPNYLAFRHLFYEIFLLEQYAIGKIENPVIIDCGSNIGMSILYFKRKHPSASIIAFEPDESAFYFLQKNIEQNAVDNVELHKTAVYNKNGEIEFLSAQEEDWCSLLEMSIFPSSLDNRKLKSSLVNCVKLSDFVNGNIDLLKIDVQGSETIVISELAEGGKLNNIDQIIMEYHYDDVNNPIGRLLSILQNHQFGISLHTFHQDRMPPYCTYRDKPYCLGLYAYRK